MTRLPNSFGAEVHSALRSYGSAPCIEFERHWHSGDGVAEYFDTVSRALDSSEVPRDATVGLVVRNRPAHAAVILGCIATGRSMAMVHAFQSPEAIARDVEALDLAAVIADPQDWTAPTIAAAQAAGSAAVTIPAPPPGTDAVAELLHRGSLRERRTDATAGLHVLTSGTTGPPKRLLIEMPVLARSVVSATAQMPGSADQPPDLVYWPFGSIGVCQLIAGAHAGKRMVVLEKFSVAEWVRAVSTYGITRAGVHPAVIRMLLHSDIPRAALSSMEFVFGGSGPLEREVRAAFEHRFGIPVLWAYGATEFAGSLCAWTPDLYREWGAAKPLSTGKPLPDSEVRIVDPDTGMQVGPDTAGLLQARIPLIGPDWIATTDVASIDADGFVTVHGRADGAINRGGFKILPETVRRELLRHPAVRDACVVGVPDRRLGAVPFAAVEVLPGSAPCIARDIEQWARRWLPRPHLPVAITVVDELPRNASMKVLLPEVAALYDPNITSGTQA